MPSISSENPCAPSSGGTRTRSTAPTRAARGDQAARPGPAQGGATGIGDVALVRLLAGWAAPLPGRPAPSVVQALGRWLHWTDAIALSEALDHRVAAATRAAPARTLPAEVARRRAELAATLVDDAELRAELARAASAPEAALAACRRHHAERQRGLDAGVAALRAQLRTALAARGGDWARLAAVDQVLAEALGRRERVLLAAVPSRLAAQLQRRQQAADPGAPQALAAAMCADLQQLLLAELDLRLQPVLGLLAALTAPDAGPLAP